MVRSEAEEGSPYAMVVCTNGWLVSSTVSYGLLALYDLD